MHISLFGPGEPYARHAGRLCVCVCVCVCVCPGEEPRQRLICLTNVAGVQSSNRPRAPLTSSFLSVFSSRRSSLLTSFLPPSLSLINTSCLGHKLTFYIKRGRFFQSLVGVKKSRNLQYHCTRLTDIYIRHHVRVSVFCWVKSSMFSVETRLVLVLSVCRRTARNARDASRGELKRFVAVNV